jgi:hypothetical protein
MQIRRGSLQCQGDGGNTTFSIPVSPPIPTDYTFTYSIECDDGADVMGNVSACVGTAPTTVTFNFTNPPPSCQFFINWVIVAD